MNVREIRDELGMSRYELAHALGVSEVAVWRWETKGVKPIFVYRKMMNDMLISKRSRRQT